MSDIDKSLQGELEVATLDEVFPLEHDLITNLEGWVEDPDEGWIPPSPLIILGLLERQYTDKPYRGGEFRPAASAISSHDFLRRLQLLAWRNELESRAVSLDFKDMTGQLTENFFSTLGGVMVDSLASEMAIRRHKRLPDVVKEVHDPTVPSSEWGHKEAELALSVHRYFPIVLFDYDKKFGNDEATSLSLLVDGAYRATRTLIRSFDTAVLQAYEPKS